MTYSLILWLLTSQMNESSPVLPGKRRHGIVHHMYVATVSTMSTVCSESTRVVFGCGAVGEGLWRGLKMIGSCRNTGTGQAVTISLNTSHVARTYHLRTYHDCLWIEEPPSLLYTVRFVSSTSLWMLLKCCLFLYLNVHRRGNAGSCVTVRVCRSLSRLKAWKQLARNALNNAM